MSKTRLLNFYYATLSFSQKKVSRETSESHAFENKHENTSMIGVVVGRRLQERVEARKHQRHEKKSKKKVERRPKSGIEVTEGEKK